MAVVLDRPNPTQTWEQLGAEVRRWQVLVGHAYVRKTEVTQKQEDGTEDVYRQYHVLNPYEVVRETDPETGKWAYFLLRKGGLPRLRLPDGSVERLVPEK